MGCWNGTCAISNLPILAGEKTKVVLLHAPYASKKENPLLGISGFCYPHGIMAPAFYALEGEYDDYGGVENLVEDWNYKIVEAYIQNKWKKIRVEGTYPERVKELDTFTLPQVLEAIERNVLEVLSEEDSRVKDLAIKAMEAYKDTPEVLAQWKDLAEQDVSEQWRKSPFSFVMIRKDVWDHIVASDFGFFWNLKKKRAKNDPYEVSAKVYCEYTFKEIRKLKKPKEDDPMVKMEAKWAVRNGHLFRMGEGGSLLGESWYAEALIMSLGDKRLLDQFYTTWMEDTAIRSWFNVLRKAWLPQAGAGSQSQEWTAYKYLNKIVDKICDDHIKEEEE